MNHMKEVAQMLGVKLYENFRYKSALTGLSKIELRFTEKYLEGYSPDINAWFNVSFETICNLLNGEYEVVKLPKPILTMKEKEYLTAVIKPFREDFRNLVKYQEREYEYLVIYLNCDFISLPVFKIGSRYKELEINKKYTLKELGL